MSSKTATGRRRSGVQERRPRETSTTARDHYLREKARRASEPHPNSELMAAAKREYLALLAQEAAKGKGGRPKKKPGVAPADTEPMETESDQE